MFSQLDVPYYLACLRLFFLSFQPVPSSLCHPGSEAIQSVFWVEFLSFSLVSLFMLLFDFTPCLHLIRIGAPVFPRFSSTSFSAFSPPRQVTPPDPFLNITSETLFIYVNHQTLWGFSLFLFVGFVFFSGGGGILWGSPYAWSELPVCHQRARPLCPRQLAFVDLVPPHSPFRSHSQTSCPRPPLRHLSLFVPANLFVFLVPPFVPADLLFPMPPVLACFFLSGFALF